MFIRDAGNRHRRCRLSWPARSNTLLSKIAAPKPRSTGSEAGDTLIEILIAIVIIALTVTALLSGLVTAITSSSTEQSLASEDAIVNGFAQSAQYEIQQASVFANCQLAYRLISAPFPSSGPVGSQVTVFVTGLTASHPVTVTLGSTSASIVSGGTTDGSGDASITFKVPSVSGSQTVTVNDGTATPVTSPTSFSVGGTAQGTTPTGYKVFVNPVQQYDSQAFAQGGNPWVPASGSSCPDSGAQLITVFARNTQDGSLGTVSFVALGQATTTVIVTATSSSPSATLGDTLTFTAKVVPPNSTTAAPVGSVEWVFDPQSPPTTSGAPSCPDSNLTPIPGTNTSSATCAVSGVGVGIYTVTANYPATGTTNNNYGQGSGVGTITVGKANAQTTVTEVSSPTPAQPGSKLTFTATVGANPAVSGAFKPSGPVIWSVTGPGGSTVTCQDLSGHTLTNNTYTMAAGGTGTNTAPCVIPSASVGSYAATASYGGDNNYQAAAPAQGPTVSVSKATPTITFVTSPTSPQVGGTFKVTATVNEPPGGLNPTGTLNWTITAPSGSPTCAASNLDSNGSGSCTITNAVKGPYTVAATYLGNTTYNAANGSTQVTVTLAPAGSDIQAPGNANGKPDNTDTIVYTYNQAMSLTSIMSGWTGNSVSVLAEFTRTNGQTKLNIQCNTFRCNNDPNLGTVNLGDASGTHYLNGGGFNGSTVDLNATMVASTDAAGQTVITITLTQSSNSFNTVNGNTTLSWSPDNGATNTAGVAVATTTVTESGSPKKNF